VTALPALLAAILIKPGLVLIGAAGIAAGFRRRPAEARHLIWAGALLAVLALPLLSRAIPPLRLPASLGIVEWRLPVIRGAESASAGETPKPSGTPGTAGATQPLDRPERSAEAAELIGTALLALWLLGVLVLGARRMFAETQVRRLLRAGRNLDDPVLVDWIGGLAASSGMRGPVRLRLSEGITSPGVTGVLRPVVLLPAAAVAWPRDRLSQVLTHEFAHIIRRDGLLNLMADLAGIVYWCNPLVRSAVRRLRTESEHACDDRVIRSGAEPGEYAGLLLTLAHAGRMEHGLPGAVTAMARPLELESRLLAVLDTRVARDPLPRWMPPALAALGLLLSLPAAALAVDRPLQSRPDLLAAEPDRRGDSLASPASERLPEPIDSTAVALGAQRALAGPDSILARLLVAALDREPQGEEDLVRERAAWALSQVTGDRLVEPLLHALDSADWRIRAYAAWALAPARDSRATGRLALMLGHPVWRLRAMAAYALGELADPGTSAAMNAALTDPAWQVRVEAVEYFARLGGAGLAGRLRPRLTDRHMAVRHAAEQALTTR
jgi:beta-lactamase regulating signal transducer with metallopeptidase domain